MSSSFGKYKPAASVRTHLLFAALMWSVIGLLLVSKGLPAFWSGGHPLLLVAALCGGTIKSICILDRVAARNLDRICAFEDNTCLGGVYSVKTWLFVAGMILAGRVLRMLAVPIGIIGFIQVAVGWALLVSSRSIWFAWYHRSDNGADGR